MSTEPFLGEIKIFGFDFEPKNFATCKGQFLSIAQNTALFSLLGTQYGGNGQTTFALPDLQGRIPVGFGYNAVTRGSYIQGEKQGKVSTTLLTPNLPTHQHNLQGVTISIPVSEGGADTDSPESAFLANTSSGLYANTSNDITSIAMSGTTGIAGSSQPITIENSYLTLNYSIALRGIFPSRN